MLTSRDTLLAGLFSIGHPSQRSAAPSLLVSEDTAITSTTRECCYP
jgi:hypothetical protein